MRKNAFKSLPVMHGSIFGAAIVIAEYLLIQIAKQMERLDADIGSLQPALEQAPEVFKSVGVNLAVNVLLRVVDNAVIEMLWQSDVRHKIIGVNGTARLDVLFNLAVKYGPFAIRNYGSAYLALAVEQPENFSFAANSARVELPTPCASDVHVTSLATDEGFVYLDFAAITAELHKRTALHGETDSLQHEPCGLLSDANRTSDLVGTDSVLAIANHPNGDKPFVERDRRILKDSPDLDTELPMVVDALALPLALIGEKFSVFAATGRAFDAIRPAKRNHPIQAVIWIGKVDDGVLECFWLVHCCHRDSYTTSSGLDSSTILLPLQACENKTDGRSKPTSMSGQRSCENAGILFKLKTGRLFKSKSDTLFKLNKIQRGLRLRAWRRIP